MRGTRGENVVLSLVAYDIHQPQNWSDLEGGIQSCSTDQRNVDYAPWFIDTSLEPTKVARKIARALGPHRQDDLLILQLGSGVSAAFSNPCKQMEPKLWLERHGVDFRGRERTDVQAVAYTLHGANRSDYTSISDALASQFPDHFKPVNALWFIAGTGATPSQLCHELKSLLPSRHDDELLVMSIPNGTVGKSKLGASNKDALAWFNEHGIGVI